MEQIDVAVIGGGVTGLATALALAERGLSICVMERHPRPGMEASTHNSGVIHAGIYYPAGSLKARLCVEGRRELYAFCARHAIAHERCGKLIVAADEHEIAELEALQQRGAAAGAEGLTLVDRAFIAAREPAVQAVAALFSPSTRIGDAEALVRTLRRLGQAAGVLFLPHTSLMGADGDATACAHGRARNDPARRRQRRRPAADDVRALGGERFRIYPCRGEYAERKQAKRSVVSALVYPLRDAAGHGVGVHLTRSIGGNVWLGPTVRVQDRKDDYEDDRLPVEAYVEPARQLLPEIGLADLRLSGSGIRAKLHPPEESFADFMIRRDRENPAVVQVAGIDSPGLTSCLAVGSLVSELAAEILV